MLLFTYIGGFRLPHDIVMTVTPRPNAYPEPGKLRDGFNSGGAPFALDPLRHELVVGTRHSRVGRVSVVAPALVDDVRDLPVAPLVDPWFVDVSGNTWNLTADDQKWDGVALGGVLPWGDSLIASGVRYYDTKNLQRRGHLSAEWPPKSLHTPQHGPWRTVGPSTMQGLIAGYMAPIPPNWQQRLKGKALTGAGYLPIITRGTTGPSAWSFDPDKLRDYERVDATFLVGYPNGHATLGKWGTDQPASEVYASTTEVNGVAIVDDLAVFAGKHGYGQQCYGPAVSDPKDPRIGQPVVGAPGEFWCYDPTTSDKGQHAYPYRYQLWIYSLLDLAAVAAGERDPWSLIPTIATLTVPFGGKHYRVNGIVFDDVTRILYVSVRSADGYGLEPGPVVHCYRIEADRITPTELELLQAENADLNKQLDALEKSRLEVLELLEHEETEHNKTKAVIQQAIEQLRQSVEGEPN